LIVSDIAVMEELIAMATGAVKLRGVVALITRVIRPARTSTEVGDSIVEGVGC
jgi:hypothetical protein